MTINQIIKYLPAPICGDTVIWEEKQKEYDAHDTAVNILRKYQKIQEIHKKWFCDYTSAEAYTKISEVLEDGKTNSYQ